MRPPLTLVADALLGDHLTRACATAGLRLADAAGTRLVATVGEPRRRVSDAAGPRRRRPPVAGRAAAAVRIGPFVEPGRTACLRCVDAHLGDARRASGHGAAPARGAPGGAVRRLGPAACVHLGVAWAVRDVVRRLDGEPPALRSATVTVTADLEVTRRDWLRHPHCGCAWG